MFRSNFKFNFNSEDRFIWGYILFQTTISLLFWMPIFFIFQKNSGLSDEQSLHIQSIYYLVFCLLELPTGFFADHFGRRKCLILGAFFSLIGNSLPLFHLSYFIFLSHWLLIALSRSLVSGAGSALLYDFLKEKGKLEKYLTTESRARSYSLYVKIVGWIPIGFLFSHHQTLPYLLSACSALLSIFIAILFFKFPKKDLTLLKNYKISKFKKINPFFKTYRLIRRDLNLLRLMLQGTPAFVLVRICQVNLFQPLLVEKGMKIESLGWIMSFVTLFEAMGSSGKFYPKWLKPNLNGVLFTTTGLAMGLAACAFSRKNEILFSLGFFSFFAGLAFPLQKTLMNHSIKNSKMRASILSIESILNRALCVPAAWFAGNFIHQNKNGGSLNLFLWVLSFFAVIWTLLFSIPSLTFQSLFLTLFSNKKKGTHLHAK